MLKDKFNLTKYMIWFAIFILGLMVLHKPLNTLDLTMIINTLRAQSFQHMLILFVSGLIVVSLSTLYDFILCHAFHLKITPGHIFRISWISDMALNFAEDAEKRKGSLRYQLYQSEGVDPKKALFIDALKDMVLFDDSGQLPVTFQISFITRFKLILSTLIKWLLTSFFFIYIFNLYLANFDTIDVLLVFAFSMFIATVSLIPYGFGIFEVLALICFTSLGYEFNLVVLVLITFRVFYSIIPWVLTMLILALGSSKYRQSKLSESQRHIVNLMNMKAFSALTLFSGGLLILSASLPEALERTQFLQPFFSLDFIKLSKLVTMGIGLLLIILSKGIWDKIQKAYSITLLMLALGSILALLKGLNIEIAFILIIIMLILAPAKESFYRIGSNIKSKRCFYYFLILGGISFIYISVYNYFTQTPLHLLVNRDTGIQGIDIIIFLFFITLGSILLNLFAVQRSDFKYATDEDLEQLSLFLKQYEGNAMTHLLFLKDKCFFYAVNHTVLIAYRPYKDKLMVLGDPIGETKHFKEAINAFRLFADQYDMTPIFYEINEAMLPIYHENGFKFLKLGEEAAIDLHKFSLAGKKGAPLRTIKNKMNRGELTFQLIHPPFESTLLKKLHTISDLWLDGRNEKCFSLGSFDPSYIERAPVGIIMADDEIVGFATLMPHYSKHTISIDLMRIIPHAPNGAMDALFIGLIEWAIEEGYTYFILGKAPLSNVGVNQFSTTKEKLAKYIYQYGNKIYSFKGLRKYKEKFYPEWRSVYLAYPKGTHLPNALIQLTKMISGSDKNTFH